MLGGGGGGGAVAGEAGSPMRPSLGQEGGEEGWSQVGMASESRGIRVLMDLSLRLP